MEFVCIKKGEKINPDKNVINHFFYYHVWEDVKDLDNNDKRKRFTNLIINTFKKNYIEDFSLFYYTLKSALCDFDNDNEWLMCSYPSHDSFKTKQTSFLDIMLSTSKFFDNIHYVLHLIKKNCDEPSKHTKEYGSRSVEKDLNTLELSKDVKDKRVIVIDDVTTSGSSLEAAKRLLINNGAKKVVLIAFAKTYDRY